MAGKEKEVEKTTTKRSKRKSSADKLDRALNDAIGSFEGLGEDKDNSSEFSEFGL